MAVKFDGFPLYAVAAVFVVFCFPHVASALSTAHPPPRHPPARRPPLPSKPSANPPPRHPPARHPPPPSKPSGCPVKYNSTSPTGYFLYHSYFSSSKPAISKGVVTGGFENLTTQCSQKCSQSKYGFYLRGFAPYPVDITCYCIMGELDYSVGESINGVTFIKTCPITKAPPPPRHPPARPPPPPFKPSGCKVAYNSSNPAGFFFFGFDNIPENFPIFSANSTNSVDVWPYTQATKRCSNVCAKYIDGFYITGDKYFFNVNCFCLKSKLIYEPTGVASEPYYFYYSRACPSKK